MFNGFRPPTPPPPGSHFLPSYRKQKASYAASRQTKTNGTAAVVAPPAEPRALHSLSPPPKVSAPRTLIEAVIHMQVRLTSGS